jgi:DNA-binding beta-propeller fold protein YncE
VPTRSMETPTMPLVLLGQVRLPDHPVGGFDHGDVHTPTGRVFVAHTANGTVEVIDGEQLTVERTLAGCPDASGVLCAQDGRAMVFAAARGAGSVLIIDPTSCEVRRKVDVGPSPNGLAWDPDARHLLVADVQTYDARLIDPETGACLTALAVRP